jgi:hypothetical protein
MAEEPGCSGSVRDGVRLGRQLCVDTSLDVGALVSVACDVPAREVWSALVTDGDQVVCALVAGNVWAPGRVLAGLEAHRSSDVRRALAGNISTPAAVLSRLARDRALRPIVERNSAAPWAIRRVALARPWGAGGRRDRGRDRTG